MVGLLQRLFKHLSNEKSIQGVDLDPITTDFKYVGETFSVGLLDFLKQLANEKSSQGVGRDGAP